VDDINLKVVADPSPVVALTAAFRENEKTLKLLTESFEAGYVSAEEYQRETQRLASAQEDLAGRIRTGLIKSLDEVKIKTQLAAAGLKGMGQSVTAAGYAFQDFTSTSGDLGAKLNSISNNLPNLLSGLGAFGTYAAIAATAAIALYRSWDSVNSLWTTKMDIPKHTEDLKGMKEECQKISTALEEMEKKGRLSAEQMTEYLRLRQELATTEAKITAEKKAQEARADKTKEEKTLASDMSGLTGGKNYDKIVGALVNDDKVKKAASDAAQKAAYAKLVPQYEALAIKEAKVGLTPAESRKMGSLSGRLDKLSTFTTESDETRTTRAQALLNKAREGDVGAYRQVRGRIGNALDQQDRNTLEDFDPIVKGQLQRKKVMRGLENVYDKAVVHGTSMMASDLKTRTHTIKAAKDKAATERKHKQDEQNRLAKHARDTAATHAEHIRKSVHGQVHELEPAYFGAIAQARIKEATFGPGSAAPELADDKRQLTNRLTNTFTEQGDSKDDVAAKVAEALNQLKERYDQRFSELLQDFKNSGDPAGMARSQMMDSLQKQNAIQAGTTSWLSNIQMGTYKNAEMQSQSMTQQPRP
jgi:hypothetical protein